MYVDSHCHLDLLHLDDNQSLADVVAQAQAAGVEHLLSVSVGLERFAAIKEQAQSFDNVRISCGLHPNEVAGEVGVSKDELTKLASDPLVVAIGETGLDYYRSTDDDMAWQHERFKIHIEVARTLNKPLIIHTRNAADDTLRILSEQNAKEVGGVFHCFAEDMSVAQAAVELGFYVSFSGIVTFKNAKELQAVAQALPIDKILIETDSPYLAPTPLRGKSNFPAYVVHVAEKIAELKNLTVSEVAQATTENYFRCFPLAKSA